MQSTFSSFFALALRHAATLIFSREPVALYCRRKKKLAQKKKGYAAQLFRRLPVR